MKLKLFLTVASFLVTTNIYSSSTTFATKRLKTICGRLCLNQIDTLLVGCNEQYHFHQHPLVIRKNKKGEIEHIGLKLFGNDIRDKFPSPLYDFLERYLLERNLYPIGSEEEMRMSWDHVQFLIGNAEKALLVDTNYIFSESHEDLKKYNVAWSFEDKTLLQMSFDMDYQLMSGCSEIELEEIFMRCLSHFEAERFVFKQQVNFPDTGEEFIQKGDFFISPLICNDRFYTKKDGDWKLVKSKERASQSIANLMLDANVNDTVKLVLIMDQYGYKKDTLSTSYRQFIQLCLKEGCVPYYGLKDKADDIYNSTIFLVNRQGGYFHMLSVMIPQTILEKPDSSIIRGKLYVYIPLFNVSDKIVNPQNYKFVNK